MVPPIASRQRDVPVRVPPLGKNSLRSIASMLSQSPPNAFHSLAISGLAGVSGPTFGFSICCASTEKGQTEEKSQVVSHAYSSSLFRLRLRIKGAKQFILFPIPCASPVRCCHRR